MGLKDAALTFPLGSEIRIKTDTEEQLLLTIEGYTISSAGVFIRTSGERMYVYQDLIDLLVD